MKLAFGILIVVVAALIIGNAIHDNSVPRRHETCAEAIANGAGPYFEGSVEYTWYSDGDKDGIVCERN